MSVVADFGVSVNQPSVVQTALVSAAYFPRLTVAGVSSSQVRVNLLTAGAVSPYTPNATNASGQLMWPSNNAVNGQLVRIQLAGNVTTGTPLNVTISLQINTPPAGTLSNPSYNTIASTGLMTVNGGPFPWSIEAVVVGDSLSGALGGQYSAMINNAYHNTSNTNAWVPLDVTLNNLNLAGAPNGANTTLLGFVAAVQFGTGNVANTARLSQFQILAG